MDYYLCMEWQMKVDLEVNRKINKKLNPIIKMDKIKME